MINCVDTNVSVFFNIIIIVIPIIIVILIYKNVKNKKLSVLIILIMLGSLFFLIYWLVPFSSFDHIGTTKSIESYCFKTTKNCDEPAGSHSCCISHLLEMLDELSGLLGDKVFVLCGTLLALKRYDGKFMIPYANDLDVAILSENEDDFKKIIPELEQKGFVVKLQTGKRSKNIDRNIAPYRYYTIEYSKINKIHIDVAILVRGELKNGTKVLIDSTLEWKDTVSNFSIDDADIYKNWIMFEDEILPLKSDYYMGIDIYRPGKIDKFLFRMYGEDYMTSKNRDGSISDKITVNPLIKELNNYGANTSIGMGPVYIINLSKDPERLDHLFLQCKEENIYAMRGGTCCSKSLSDEDNNRFIYNNYRKYYLESGEKKCFLSHENCWKLISKNDKPSLILEDDTSLPYNFKNILDKIMYDMNTLIKSGDIPEAVVIRLGIGVSTMIVKQINTIKNTCLGTREFETGAWAYIVTPLAAQMLLDVSMQNNIKWPVDRFFNVTKKRNKNLMESRLPKKNKYMFLEAEPNVFDLKFRYKLGIDKYRIRIVQELSSEKMIKISSRSSE